MTPNPRTRPRLCADCGYNLKGLPEVGICPECGAELVRHGYWPPERLPGVVGCIYVAAPIVLVILTVLCYVFGPSEAGHIMAIGTVLATVLVVWTALPFTDKEAPERAMRPAARVFAKEVLPILLILLLVLASAFVMVAVVLGFLGRIGNPLAW
jgi:uncharacterized membrane protein